MPFKKDFIWGAAAASYQLEGAAYEDGKGLSVWDTFCRKPGAIKDGQSGDVACDHYHRYEEDAALMGQIGLKSYRFSISWPRVVPNGFDGVVNEKGLDFYDRLTDALLANGVEPCVTLFHWDMPQGVFDRGGWLNPDSAKWFEEYTEVVVKRLGNRVKNWITLNEPQCPLSLGMEAGKHAPGITLPKAQVMQAAHHIMVAHGRAIRVLREHCPDAMLSFSPVGTVYYPATETAEDIEAARRATFEFWESGFWNSSWFNDAVFWGRYPEQSLEHLGADAPVFTDEEMQIISQPVDLCSFNFYQGKKVRAAGAGWEEVPHEVGYARTAFNWPITPDAFYWIARFYHERYQKPLMITENGISCTDWVDCDGEVKDPERIDFTRRYLRALRRAADEDIPIQGYYHWSVMDNFEWAEGYTQRFGLIHIDYQTQKRTLKQSAHWYREVIQSNGADL